MRTENRPPQTVIQSTLDEAECDLISENDEEWDYFESSGDSGEELPEPEVAPTPHDTELKPAADVKTEEPTAPHSQGSLYLSISFLSFLYIKCLML